LHSVKKDKARDWGVQQSVYDKTKLDIVVTVLRERILKVSKFNIFEIDSIFIEQEIETVCKIVIPRDVDCLVHNDLDMRHLLIQDGHLSGIIDWSDVDINHPVVDFACVWASFPESMHEQFFKVYGNVDKKVWRYAKILALTRSITLMIFGHFMKDEKLLKAAIKSYEMLKRVENIKLE
jgi:macrolide phosphotransferase